MILRALAALAAVLLPAAPPAGQARAERDGRAALGRAHQALGGALPVFPRSWMVEGTGRENLSAELQGISAAEPTWRPHEERVGVSLADESAGWERRTPRNDGSLRHRRFIYRTDTTTVIDYANHFWRTTPGDVPAARRRALMRRIPHLFIHDIASRSASQIVKTRNVRVDTVQAEEIRVELPSGETFVLAIGRRPAVLLSAAYRLYFPGRGDVTVEWRWTGWKHHPRAGNVPGGHRISIDNELFQEVTYTRYDFESAAADVVNFLSPDFPRPAPMAAAPEWAASAGPASGEIAPGLHVARIGGFTVMFAEVGGGVVAFEAPEPFFGTESIPASNMAAAGTLSPQVIAEIGRRFPGLPVRYVVISHHHGDHMGGLRVFTDAGARALVAAQDFAAAQRAIGVSSGVMGGINASPLMPVSGVEKIGDGRREIHIINTGLNPHTSGTLVMWLPLDGVLIQGDLFYADAGAGFHAGRERMNRWFAEWLRARGIRPRLIYGVHNSGAVGPAALDAALR